MIRVMGNRVLVKRIEDAAPKSKYIEVITTDKEPGQYALVAAVGPGIRLPNGKCVPIGVDPGDIVILSKYSGASVSVKNEAGVAEDFHLVDGEDVLATVNKKAPIPVV